MSFAGGRFGLGSKWRLNIPRLGFVSNDKELIARLLNSDDGYNYVVKTWGVTNTYWLATPVFLQDQWAWQFTIKATGGKRFPYGREVEPDVVPANWLAEGDE